MAQQKQLPKFESESPKCPMALSDSPLGSDPAAAPDAPTESSQLQSGGVGPGSSKSGPEEPKGPVALGGSRPEKGKAKSDAPKGRAGCGLPVSSPPLQFNDESCTVTKQAPKFESEAPKGPVALSDSPLGSDLEAQGEPSGSSQLQHSGVGPGSSKSRSEAPKGPVDISGLRPEDSKAKSDAPKAKSKAPKGRESCSLPLSSRPLPTDQAQKQAPKFESEAPESPVALSDSPLGSDLAAQGAPSGSSRLQPGGVGLGSSKSGSEAPKVPVDLSGSRPEEGRAKSDALKSKYEAPKGRESSSLPVSSPPLLFNDESHTNAQVQASKFESEAPKSSVALSDSPLGSDPAAQGATSGSSQLQPGGVGAGSSRFGSEAPKGPVPLNGSRTEDSNGKSDASKSKSEEPKGRQNCNLPVSSPPQQVDESRTVTQQEQAPKFGSEVPKGSVALSDFPLGSDPAAQGVSTALSQLQSGGVGPGSSKSGPGAPKGPVDLSGTRNEESKGKSDAPRSEPEASKGRESCSLPVSSLPLPVDQAHGDYYDENEPEGLSSMSESTDMYEDWVAHNARQDNPGCFPFPFPLCFPWGRN